MVTTSIVRFTSHIRYSLNTDIRDLQAHQSICFNVVIAIGLYQAEAYYNKLSSRQQGSYPLSSSQSVIVTLSSSSNTSISTIVSYLNNAIIKIAFQIYLFIEVIDRAYLQDINYEVNLTLKYIIVNYSYLKQLLPTIARLIKRILSTKLSDFLSN